MVRAGGPWQLELSNKPTSRPAECKPRKNAGRQIAHSTGGPCASRGIQGPYRRRFVPAKASNVLLTIGEPIADEGLKAPTEYYPPIQSRP